MILVSYGLVVAGGMVFSTLKSEMFPLSERAEFLIYLDMPKGTAITATRDEALSVDRWLLALVFATEGRIAAFDFRVLDDDKGFFPNYAIAPVVRTETLEVNPQLAEPLNALSAKIDDATMQALNAQVDVDKKTIEEAATTFLTDNGLI